MKSQTVKKLAFKEVSTVAHAELVAVKYTGRDDVERSILMVLMPDRAITLNMETTVILDPEFVAAVKKALKKS